MTSIEAYNEAMAACVHHREKQQGLRLTLVSRPLSAWSGIYCDVDYAREALERLDKALPGADWEMQAINYDHIQFEQFYNEWYGILGEKISMNYLRNWHPERLTAITEGER